MPFSTRWSAGWVGSAETGGLFLIGKDASPEQQLLKLREQMCALRQRRLDADEVTLALSQFGPVWESLAPREQALLVQIRLSTCGSAPLWRIISIGSSVSLRLIEQ